MAQPEHHARVDVLRARRRLRRARTRHSLITWQTIRPSTSPGASPTHATCLPSAAKKRSARAAATGEELSLRVSSTRLRLARAARARGSRPRCRPGPARPSEPAAHSTRRAPPCGGCCARRSARAGRAGARRRPARGRTRRSAPAARRRSGRAASAPHSRPARAACAQLLARARPRPAITTTPSPSPGALGLERSGSAGGARRAGAGRSPA